MSNPYRDLPSHHFWRSAVAAPAPNDVDPIVMTGFTIAPDDRIATAGSCFAQHIARTLAASGYGYMVVEDAPAHAFCENENYGTYSARFGNVYSVRQLLQLFRRAYGTFAPTDVAWRRADGRWIDPFRPQIQSGGYGACEDMLGDRASHLAAVRTMFESCDVFIFTLGLTEAWLAKSDGAVFPLAPGTVATGIDSNDYRFHNFTVAEMDTDLSQFVSYLRGVNPDVRVILTVSPVALVATYEPRHVLVSTIYSKSALRVVAEQIAARYEAVDYFPSYEMITGAHTRGAFFAEDLRSVLPDGVAYVMAHFSRHYLGPGGEASPKIAERRSPDRLSAAAIGRAQAAISEEAAGVICEEETLAQFAPRIGSSR